MNTQELESNWVRSLDEAIALEQDDRPIQAGSVLCQALVDYVANEKISEMNDVIVALPVDKFQVNALAAIATVLVHHRDKLPCYEGYIERVRVRLKDLGLHIQASELDLFLQ